MTRRHAVLLASALVLGLVATPKVAAAQKPGGIMKVYFFDSPATMSIHEESTIAGQGPMMGVFNNLVMYDPRRAAKRAEVDRARPRHRRGRGTRRGRTLVVQAALGRALARRQAVHRARREVHLRPAAGHRLNGETLRVNPRKTWYGNLAEVVAKADDEVVVPSEAAAARLYRAARLGLHADLSLPRDARRDAAAADRHRAVPLRRVQAERGDPRRAQQGLLEEGPAVSRRHRMEDHEEQLDRHAVLHRRHGRHDLALFLPGAGAERRHARRRRRRSAS